MTHIPDDLYRTIVGCMPIPFADAAVVSDAGAVLLLKRKAPPAVGQWWVPGGRVLKGERMAETAARKAREEVGLDCHVGRIIHTAETIFPDGPFGLPIHSVNCCFLLHPKDRQAGPRAGDDYQWVTGVPAGLHPYVAECLRQAGLRPDPDGPPQW